MDSTSTHPANVGQPSEELARLADLAWTNKRLWWMSWAFPFPLYVLAGWGMLSRDDPVRFALRHWPVLEPFYLDEDAIGIGLVLLGSLVLRSRVGTALAGLAQATRAGGQQRELFSYATGSWRSAIPLLFARFLLGSITLTLLLLPTSLLRDSWDSPFEPFVLVRLLPFWLLALGYGFTLDACTQLGVQSIAANDRGAASAFQHGWRLLGADPWQSAKWIALWAGLILGYGLFGLMGLSEGMDDFGGLVFALSIPFVGAFSAYYWAEAYHRLGGLRTIPVERL